jgi:hypothetical protein
LRVSYKTMLNKITAYGLTRTNGHAQSSLGGAATVAGVLPAAPPGNDACSNPDAK